MILVVPFVHPVEMPIKPVKFVHMPSQTIIFIRSTGSLILLLVFVCACMAPISEGGDLAFTTVEAKHDPAYIGQQQYYALQPGLLVIFNEESAMMQGDLFSEAARLRLSEVNWQTHFALAAFQGWQAGEGYAVEIQGLRIQDGVLRIFADFLVPDAPPQSGAPVTSPYQLILVPRPVPTLESLPFELVVDSQTVAVFPTEAP